MNVINFKNLCQIGFRVRTNSFAVGHLRRFVAPTFCALLLALTTSCGQNSSEGLGLSIGSSEQLPDPVVQDYPVFFITRPTSSMEGATRQASPRQLNIFDPGANIVMKTRALPSALEQSLLTLEGDFDIRDLTVDTSGERIAFSMRGPFIPDADLDEQPSWNIWVYKLESATLERVITSDTLAEAGQDRFPAFLPDNRIVFSSTRQRQARAILLDEGRPQFSALDEDNRDQAFTLHTMEPDGTNLTQLTFNQSHDFAPLVLSSGEILFTRWDNSPGRDALSIYRIKPDGTQLERWYGYHSADTGRDGSSIALTRLRETESGELLAIANLRDSVAEGGDVLMVDHLNFVEHNQPIFGDTGQSAQSSPLQEIVSLTGLSARGRFNDAYPLSDGSGRLLIAWSQCRVQDASNPDSVLPCPSDSIADPDPGFSAAAPLFGLWILDPGANTQQPVVTPVEGINITEAVVAAPQNPATFIAPIEESVSVAQLKADNAGILSIRSVYDLTGVDTAVPDLQTQANPSLTSADDRAFHFLRLYKPVSQPDRETREVPNSAFGRSRAELMREIIGYATIHPDGSVLVKVPANVAIGLSLTDRRGRRLSPRHRNWLQVRPGETLKCQGCHEADSEVPHGRLDAEQPSINMGGPYAGLAPEFTVAAMATMAEAHADNLGAAPAPSMDINFEDIWTDPAARTPDESLLQQYADLTTTPPVRADCTSNWQANCRITPHYPLHIHPLWQAARPAGQACTSCHSPTDDLGQARVPEAQLDLSDVVSNEEPMHLRSYRELLFGDVEQEVVDGVLIDRLIPLVDNQGNIVFELDEEGELLLDAEGNPIPVMVTVGLSPALSTAGAVRAIRFFSLFGNGGSHEGFLSDAELRLISEWLDLGAQYYNDPFAVPLP